jgi:glycosyltransferase involved in cell wall biosynthesis
MAILCIPRGPVLDAFLGPGHTRSRKGWFAARVMHIGLEVTTLRSPQLGGVWRYTDSLVRALAKRIAPHRCSLLFINKPWARVPPPAVPSSTLRLVDVTSVSNFLFTFLVPMLPTVARLTVESFLGPVDVFHSINAALLPQRQGSRVVTVQDLTCLHFPQFHPWGRRMLFRLSIRRAARLADAIVVPSLATRRDLGARFPSAEPKTHVVPLAPDERFVPLGPEESRPVIGRYGLGHREYLLFLGNIEPRKNLPALLDAYTRMRAATGHSVRLAIAGGVGWKNEGIHRTAAASPFAADIRLLGHVPEPELPALVNGALAFVYPSLYEGFGLPPLEAMACGTPVIASNRSSLPEVVGDAALLVDPDDRDALADALARITREESLREDLRERGLKQAQRYSWDETARLTVEVYERVHRGA